MTYSYNLPHCSRLVCGTKHEQRLHWKNSERPLKRHDTFRWVQINSLSSWVCFNMCTWKMERISLLTPSCKCVIVLWKQELTAKAERKQLNVETQAAKIYFIYFSDTFTLLFQPRLHLMVLPIASLLKDAANFELRAKVCLRLEPHLSAVIFIPGTCESSYCFESPVGFAVGLFRKWAHTCATVSKPAKLKKLNKLGRSLEKKKVWVEVTGWDCRTNLWELHILYLDIHWEKNLELNETKGETFYPVPSGSFCTGRKR